MTPLRTRAAVLVLLALSLLAPATALGGGSRQVASASLAPGLTHEVWALPGTSARVHVARLGPDTPARVRVVPSTGGLVAGRETPGAACRRTRGCRLAVNGDFYTDGGPRGGVVVGGRMLRSPRSDHEQVSLEPRRLTARGLDWAGTVTAPGAPVLPVDVVNDAPAAGQVVLYTPDLGPATPACTCTEVVLREVSGRVGLLGQPATLAVVGRAAGGTPLPAGSAVLATTGGGLDALAGTVTLALSVAQPTRQNLGAHPLLLRDGRRVPTHPDDVMLAERHPRTVVAWDRDGTVLLLAFEGRRPGGPGPTADEVAAFLLERGTTDAAMLDGGGSTTMVTADRVLSRSSDGAERPVAGSLVVVWDPPPTVPRRPAAARVAVRAATAPTPLRAAPRPTAPTASPLRAPAPARGPATAAPRPVVAAPVPAPVPTTAAPVPSALPVTAPPLPAAAGPAPLAAAAAPEQVPAAVRAAALTVAAALLTWVGTVWLLVARRAGGARRAG